MKLALAGALTVPAIVLVVLAQSVAAPRSPASHKRSRPPKWDQRVTDLFWSDAREKLVGERPVWGDSSSAAPADGSVSQSGSGALSSGSFGWSKLVSPEVLEDEIKTLQAQVSENVQTPAKFKGGGYKNGRREFTELATLFAIVAQYDGEVRWKKQAGGIRDAMARAGFNCKVGTDASYNEAKLRKDDLEALVRGGNVQVPSAEGEPKWDKISGRSPLMQRIEQAYKDGLAIWVSNPGDFSKNNNKVLHEAQLLAALSEVIQREGFEFADDDTYLGFARQMRNAALEVAEAARQKNFEHARKAGGEISKACSGCHEGYRGN